jgi:SAM-dependent methyltransferase
MDAVGEQQISNARVPYEGCPLCGAKTIEPISNDDCSWHEMYKPQLPPIIHWMRCIVCTHIFTSGYWSDEALAVLFSDVQAVQAPSGHDVEAGRLVSAAIVEQIEAMRGYRQGRWLDVGFGNGSLLVTAEEFGWKPVGLDLRESSVREMRAIGIEAHVADIADFRPAEPFDVISLADVLEHMPFPKPALLQIREILVRDGLLFLSMPNIDCYAFREATSRQMNPYWNEIEHYHNFGRERLYSLLIECGFRPLRYGVNQRYRMGMQVFAVRDDAPQAS